MAALAREVEVDLAERRQERIRVAQRERAALPVGDLELEKAVYELRYELNNRPDWVRIPVAGIARLLEEPLP